MRRAANPIQRTDTQDPLFQGPVGDYAVVFFDADFLDDNMKLTVNDAPPVADWKKHLDPCDKEQVERQKGAVRLASVDCAAMAFERWKPRDKMSRIEDGMSKTAIIAEKHLRLSELRKYSAKMNEQDGVFLFEAEGGREFGVARNLRLPLGKLHTAFDEPGMGPDDDFGFGSQHEVGVQFLLCDGSVRTLAFETDPQVLFKLGHCQDGFPVELP
jgi:hypothetical protein